MKKFILLCGVLLILAFGLLLSPISAFAHQGNTDKNGGHYDQSTGKYHYHHGYPAHDHPNGVCPYDYHDNTNPDNGGDSKNNGNSLNIGNGSTQENQTSSSKSNGQSCDNNKAIMWIVIAIAAYVVIFEWIIPECKKK